jgi:hypothetical protein
MLNTPVIPSTEPRNEGCEFYTARALPDGEWRRPVEAISIEAAHKWFRRFFDPPQDYVTMQCTVRVEGYELVVDQVPGVTT